MDNTSHCPPIFVVGVPRSGTTLLSAMLGAHPRLVCGPETHFFQFLPEEIDSLCRPEDWPGPAIDYLYSIRHVGESIPGNYGLTRQDLAEALARRPASIPSILSGMLELYAERYGRARWVEKTPDHLPDVARIRRYYPDSPIVRIVRDPRAVAASLLAVTWGPSTLFEALTFWRNYDDRSARFFETDSRCYTLRYENLVSDPEAELRALCRAIGETFDPVMLNTRDSARLVNATNEPHKSKVAEKADASRAEAWRERFSEGELQLTESWIGDRLRNYGYPTIGPGCSHYVEAYPRNLMDLGPGDNSYAGADPLDQSPDVVAAVAARGGRFWKHPGEKPALSLFLGNPNGWIGYSRQSRRTRTAWLAWIIIRRRMGGVPMVWLEAPDPTAIPGRCGKMIARMLPRPTAGHCVPDLVHSIDGHLFILKSKYR